MSQEDRWKGHVRVMIYPIQFTMDPLQRVSDVLAQLRRRATSTGESLDEMARSIEKALGSTESLSTLVPQDHSEDVLRAYLAALRSAIAAA